MDSSLAGHAQQIFLLFLNAWTEAIEEGNSIDTIYLDFTKAFDTVPHERLLRKLDGLGVQGKILGWIRSFLSNRTQKVIVDGEESGWRDVISGIPQGSVLSPMLFICFINDLPKDVKTNVFIFADDTKFFATVPENNAVLQQDLSTLQNWSEKWQLRFNTTKYKVMHLENQAEPSDYFMLANNELNTLETIHMEKDLGVNVDD